MRKFAIITILCFAGLHLPAQTDHFQFSRLQTGQGLSHNQINSIYRDHKGFIWFGTMSGLNRYDGYNVKVYRHNLQDSATMADDYIVRLFGGPDQTIWVTNRSGINIYNSLTEKFDRNTSAWLAKYALPPATVIDIVHDRRGQYWFLMDQSGLYKYDTGTRKTIRVKTMKAAPVAVAEDRQGDIWIVHNNGVLEKADGQTAAITTHSEVLADQIKDKLFNFSLYIDADNELWLYVVGEPQGIYHINQQGKLHHYTKEAGWFRLNNNLVNGLVQDSKGNIWACTDHGGINVLDKKRYTSQYILSNEDDPKSLSQNSITTAYKDNAGIIWIGTYKKGISYFREKAVRFPLWSHQPSDPQSLPYNDVNRFVEDAAGNLWIGTNGGGLLYYNRAQKTFRQYLHNPTDANSISNNVIVSLYIDHMQKLWIGSYFGGLDCFDGKRFVHYQHTADTNSLSDNRVWEILEDNNKQLWVGTMSGGLDRYDRKTNIFHHYRSAPAGVLNANYIATLVQDSEGKLWIGTANGVDVLGQPGTSKESVVHYNNMPGQPGSLSNNNVLSMVQDARGHIWIGTRDGLNVFDAEKRTFQVFRTNDGLPDNTVLTLVEDKQHTLWISTPNGLAHIIPQYDQKNQRFTLQCHKYDELDGLQATSFNENAAYITRKGELIFGGANGFNIFHAETMAADTQTTSMVFTDLRLFNKSIGIGEEVNGRTILTRSLAHTNDITLRYDQNVLSVEFAALNYSMAEKNRYAYKLEGFMDEWTETDGKMRTATYTNLDPGHYTLRVRSATSNESWNKEELALHITILPPFWKTSWAYIIYIILLGVILWISRHLVIQRARSRFRHEQERREAQRMHELDMMKIRFFTNVSHEFRTPLALILSPIDTMIQLEKDAGQQKQLKLIHRNARRLLNLVNQLLDFRKMEVQELRLNATRGDIIKYIKEISWSFTDIAEKKHIRFNIESSLDTLNAPFDADKLERILFNLISNAFKFTPETGSITIVINKTAPQPGQWFLTIQVKDTGIGIPHDKHDKIFERFFQQETPGSIVNQGSGIGLSITREFVKLHGGYITVESEPEQGSCFTVWLPVQASDVTGQTIIAETIGVNHVIESEGTKINGLYPEGMLPQRSVYEKPVVVNMPFGQSREEDERGQGKKRLLLVEDNEDFRFYLKDNLRQYFTIIEAVDGKEGWQKALAMHPDLVVSDVSMPEMDGHELCRKLKKDQRTSHIPVILLTALAGEDQQLKGLETGANDYLTKPFNFEILLSRVRNLLAQQAMARKTYEKRIEVAPTNIQVASADEQFLQQVMEAIEKNISNPDFSVEELSRGVFMSRVALYKKLLAITGKTPIEFIRFVRLKRAAQLLEKSEMTVAEIAYEVGFNNPKYFSKYFKLEFQVLPSQFGKA